VIKRERVGLFLMDSLYQRGNDEPTLRGFNAHFHQGDRVYFTSGNIFNVLDLPNDKFDVGVSTGPGKYRLNDEAHAKLLDRLAEKNFVGAMAEVKAELSRFFAEPDAPYATKRNAKAWARVQTQLQQLKAATTAPGAADSLLPSPSAPVP